MTRTPSEVVFRAAPVRYASVASIAARKSGDNPARACPKRPCSILASTWSSAETVSSGCSGRGAKECAQHRQPIGAQARGRRTAHTSGQSLPGRLRSEHAEHQPQQRAGQAAGSYRPGGDINDYVHGGSPSGADFDTSHLPKVMAAPPRRSRAECPRRTPTELRRILRGCAEALRHRRWHPVDMPKLNMRWGAGKKALPPPYNKDLSKVLRHLNRRTKLGQARLANDVVTASYLHAGMCLLVRHLGPGGECTCPRQHDRRNLLSFLSQRGVTDAVAQNPDPFSQRGTTGMMRDRWASQQDFVADLVNFAMWVENYRPGYRGTRTEVAGKLMGRLDFVQAVHETAYQHTAEGSDLTPVRLSLALMATCEGDPDITAAISRAYGDYFRSWQGLYREVMSARHLRLRPGLTLSDLTNALSAATDGVILRTIGDPQADMLDHARRKSLMGLIALAIIYAFLEPEDDTDGLTLEQAVAGRY